METLAVILFPVFVSLVFLIARQVRKHEQAKCQAYNARQRPGNQVTSNGWIDDLAGLVQAVAAVVLLLFAVMIAAAVVGYKVMLIVACLVGVYAVTRFI